MMGTRRPVNRIPSGNGRYYDSHGSSNGSTSDSEDSNGSVYTPRADSRSYLLNVRPENRTTFCNIISQLTEETQPCFETTLKPRAVSEGSDAKFICMVTGYPEPELTWYKDDEEMDRYCGLPKYEILRNGKRHTLHIYKCTEEDAAIYQASARNNKGIVSCSGVLEVGTMTEYKIHQRWFAKLKRKAEAKMREIEQSRKKVKENLDQSERLRALSPERIPMKRRFSPDKKDAAKEVHVPDPNSRLQGEVTNTKEQPHNVVNGFHPMETQQKEELTTNGYIVPENIEENGKEFLAYVYETVEVITKKSTPKESYAKKKKKEEEPPLSTKDSTKEKTNQGTAKKTDGVSPPPRRTRFGKDVTKTTVEEKMEIQTPPITVNNKRFAPSILSNKSAKSAITKDAKRIKDNIVPSKKGEGSSTPKPADGQTKDNVNFSLKDMYFENSLSQPEVIKPLDQVKKTKTEVQPDVIPVNPSTQVQINTPKVAPRRSKEQRELSVGRKPPPTSSPKNEFPLPKPVSHLEQNIQDSKPNNEPPKTAADNSTGSSKVVPCITGDAAEQRLNKVESEVLVPSNVSPEDKSQKPNRDESVSPGETHEHPAPEKNKISSEDPNEEMTRTQTLQKLQILEMEYMELQKAYALLQKQLELSQKAEAAQKISKLSDGAQNNENTTTDPNKEKNLQIQEHTEKEITLIKCPSLPEQVHMETDMPTVLEVAPDSNKTKQNEQSQTNDNMSSDSIMECSLEEGSDMKHGNTDDIHQMDAMKEVSKPIEVSRETTDIVSEKASFTAKDIFEDSLKEHVVISSEVEMLEDVKEEVAKETVERLDEPIEEGIPMCSSNDTEMTSEELKHDEMKKDITLSSTVLQDTQTEVSISEIPKEGLNIDLSKDSSQLPPSEQSDQSVATLLRDVKKALESGVASSTGSSVDPASLHSSLASPQSEEEKEAEKIQIVPQKESTCSQELLEPGTASVYQKETKTETNVPSSGLSTISHQDFHKDEHSMSKQKEKQDHSLVTTLKNSLLMLLHIKTPDVDKTDEESQTHMGDAQSDSSEEMHSPQISLSPPSTRKIHEYSKESHSPQSIESMHSSSSSGKLTPASEENIVQNVDSLQTSPTIPRRVIEISKKEDLIHHVESAPQSPVTPRRSSKIVTEKTVLSKEDLSFSPATSRRIAAKIASATDPTVALTVPSIVVGNDLPGEKTLGSMLSVPPRDKSRKWRSTENLTLIPSATPEELASGARRKIFLNKTKLDNEEPGNTGSLTPPSRKESPNVSPGLSRRSNTLSVTQSPPVERRSPGTIRKMAMLEVPKIYEEDIGMTDSSSQEPKDVGHTSKDETLPTETKKINDPYKAPQVIRKIRAEQFSDASGNLKLWCQFFNILSDSGITWYKDEIQVAKVKRSSGDEGQVALAIVQASVKDCGVYQCTIENEYGSDSTDCLLSAEILSGFISKEEVEVGEEIEMTPMVFAKGLADSGYWGDKFFGRIVMENPHVGNGFLRKSCRVKVIYGLEPMFESGKTCIIKIRNLITFGTKNESTLVEKNYDITIQECKIQNTTREYCKIFAAECRGVPSFGKFPEILPLNLIYRPANNIPYATIEQELEGRFEKYCIRDLSGKLHMKNSTEIEQKCCTFQHWVFQWTNGNFLVTTLEGVGWTLTNIGIATKSKGYQGLKESCCPEVLDEFLSVHQCNSYCEMLGLKPLKATEGLQPPSKPKGSRSPQMGRKTGSAQSSPQIQKKVMSSPQTARKGGVSPKSTRKAVETGDPQSGPKNIGSEGLTIPKPQ